VAIRAAGNSPPPNSDLQSAGRSSRGHAETVYAVTDLSWQQVRAELVDAGANIAAAYRHVGLHPNRVLPTPHNGWINYAEAPACASTA
jgi:hypothetical protein